MAACVPIFLVLISAALSADAAVAPYIRNLVTFGDSILDNGMQTLINQRVPVDNTSWFHTGPCPAYKGLPKWNGTGPKVCLSMTERGGKGIWLDEVRRQAGLSAAQVMNFAIGGSSACRVGSLPTLGDQARIFALNAKKGRAHCRCHSAGWVRRPAPCDSGPTCIRHMFA